MTTLSRLIPRQPVPELSVPTIDDPRWVLAEEKPQHFNLVVFYRGLHCPLCRAYLSELNRRHDEFVQRGVGVIAISSDNADRAGQTKHGWRLSNLRVGHSLDLGVAQSWGLYISSSNGTTSVGLEEPAAFSEPGVFIVRPDRTLYFAAVQTMPFTRPDFDQLLKAIDYAIEKNYPARGELIEVPAA